MHDRSFLKLALLLSLPLLLAAPPARADDTRRLVVMPFTGPGNAQVRTLVVRELLATRGIDLAPSTDAHRQLQRNRWVLTRADDRAALADELKLGGIVIGRVRKARGYEASVLVFDDAGQQLGQVTWRAKSLKALSKKLPPKARTALLRVAKKAPTIRSEPKFQAMALADGPDIEDTEDGADAQDAAPDEPQASPVALGGARGTKKNAEPDDAAPRLVARAEAGPAPRGKGARPVFRASAGPSLFSRSFDYSDALPMGERSFNYDLPGAPLMTVGAEYYPLPWVGVRGTFTTVMGLYTSSHDGRRYEGSALSYTLGAQGHAQLGPVQLGGRLQGGQQSFSLGIEKNRDADGPDVAYTFFEPAVTARYAILPRLELAASAGFRFVTGGGELTSSVYLSRVHIGGLNAEAAVAYRITEDWEVQVSGGVQRYFATAAPAEGAAITRGAAVDVFRQVGVGLAWRIN